MNDLVFVSHSCNGQPADHVTVALRDRVVAALEANGYGVWLDRARLHPSDLWAAEIHRALAECRGAVVLLDQKALTSEWVRKETTILAHRRWMNPAFRLVTVLVDQPSTSVLEESPWKPLGLRAMQVVVADSADVEATVRAVLREFPDLPSADDPFERNYEFWISNITAKLAPLAAAVHDVFDDQARELGVAGLDWRAEHGDPVRTFTRALVTADWGRVAAVLRTVAKGAGREDRIALAGYCRPVWVELAGAASLLQCMRSGGNARVFINTGSDDIAVDYLRRATGCSPHLRVATATGVYGEQVDELVEQYVNAAYGESPPSVRAKRTAEAYAAWREKARWLPVLLVRPGHLPPALLRSVLDQVAERCPGLTFVVLCENADVAPSLEPPPVHVVQPQLTPAAADDAVDFAWELNEFVGEPG